MLDPNGLLTKKLRVCLIAPQGWVVGNIVVKQRVWPHGQRWQYYVHVSWSAVEELVPGFLSIIVASGITTEPVAVGLYYCIAALTNTDVRQPGIMVREES